MKRDVEASVVIDRPIGEVFERVTDVHSALAWQAELVEVKEVSEFPLSAGTTFTAVLLFLGRHIENTMRVTAYQPPHRFSLTTVAGRLPVDLDFTLEPVNGGTHLTFASDWELPSGFLFRLVRPAKPIFDRMDQRVWQSNLETLKELLEA